EARMEWQRSPHPIPACKPHDIPPPPTPLKSILKRRLETFPGSGYENLEPCYFVGIYDRLFSQRDINGRFLRADYKRDLRGGARIWGKKPQTIMYVVNRGPIVENLHGKFFYRDEFPAHALAKYEDEAEDGEESSGKDDHKE
ncbi:hypothetical protein RUND412_004377, partial [Rhizina undulata]